MNNLLVSIATRDRPDGLSRTLKMLYQTCQSRNNFDIQVIIDNDQIEMYKDVIKQHPEYVWWTFTEHNPSSWLNLFNAQHKLMRETNYYFFFGLTDDMYGLSKDWDKAILDKKKAFDDDLFVLYTQSHLWGRFPYIHSLCYTWDPWSEIDSEIYRREVKPTYADTITLFHESFPVWTKKFGEFIFPLFDKTSKLVWGRELMIAGIIRFLYEEHGENRNVPCEVDYETADNNYSYHDKIQCWYDLQDRGYDDLKVVATRMKEYIDKKVCVRL